MASEEDIATLQAVTGVPRLHAEQLLSAFGDVERAINFYLENEQLPPSTAAGMTDDDAQLAARLMAADDEPIFAGERGPGTTRHAPASIPHVEEPEDDEPVMATGSDDEEAMLRTMAAHRAAGIAAAREAERTMEAMMRMSRDVFGGGSDGLPSMFPGLPGLAPPGGHLGLRGHPITLDSDPEGTDGDHDMAASLGGSGRLSGGRMSGGLAVQGRRVIPVQGPSTRAARTVGTDMGMGAMSDDDEGFGPNPDDEDPDLALARRLQAEEQEMAAARGARLGSAGPAAVPPPVVVRHDAGAGGEDDEHVGLGVDRHELEEARMIEAAMLGIPYEPRLPTRSTESAAPADPTLREHRSLRWEQDQAFEESLAADRAKAEAAARAAAEAEAAAERERAAAEAAAAAAAAEAARVTAVLASKAAGLPSEPPAGEPGSVSIMIRLPDGQRLSRRFRTSDTLQAMFDFVDVQQQCLRPGARLVTSYPRKVFENGSAQSLRDVGINADTALFLEVPTPPATG